ncbi:glycine cleavage system protein R [Pararhodospirillum photometricum]|uniref:Amino acid-binding ACT n=1 Tax=Pararhodospirillum photometricum DSM 122 TaxID=1150469 RepID=H6SQA7_PARPM|nr:ACT domain-containing protein [Pararhodospirillum photometricum]CCG09626.1 Amino acid-binding ACT [Pararhodospirillum photometricum DSM 122]
MTHTLRIAVSGPDRTGLVAALTGRLFDLGAELADTSFATLGQAAEFTLVCDLPDAISADDVRQDLAGLPALAGYSLWVGPFDLPEEAGVGSTITHRLLLAGGNRPGLVARLAEVFGEFGAGIVRLDSNRLSDGKTQRYLIRFEINLPDDREMACLATIKNTAEDLGLTFSFERL